MPNNVRSESIKIRNQTIAELKRIYGNGWRKLFEETGPIIDTLYLDEDGATQAERLAHADKNGKDELIDIYVAAVVMANGDAISRINGMMESVYDVNANDIRQYVLGKTGIDISAKDASQKTLTSKYTKKSYSAKLNKGHVSRTILREIDDMMKKGSGTRAIAKRLNDLFYRHRWAAFRTTITEFTRISTLSQLDTIREAEKKGMKFVKIWNHSHWPKDPRNFHVSMHGQERYIDEYFTSGLGNEAIGPGHFDIAEEDINCSCYLTRELREW